MKETLATTDAVSCIVLFCRSMRKALSGSCGVSLTSYRLLSFLEQHADGASLSKLASTIGLSAGTVCLSLQELEDSQLVVTAHRASRTPKAFLITDSGRDVVSSCDDALSEACQAFFDPLSAHSRATLLSGSLVTSSFLGMTRLNGSTYFAQYSVLVSFLKNELNFTKIAKTQKLCLGEYRVLLALFEHPSMRTARDICIHLIVHKSEFSNWCSSLIHKGYIVKDRNPNDRRAHVLALTPSGSKVVERINRQIDDTVVRPIEDGEIPLYTEMFKMIMDANRKPSRERR